MVLFIPGKKLKASSSHLAYKEYLMKEMKELVDSFYLDMTIKICSIIKMQKREISDMKREMKYMRERGKSAHHREETSESTISSNKMGSSWTKEKQFHRLNEIVQLSSAKNNLQPYARRDLPNVVGLHDKFWDSSSCASTLLSPAPSDCHLSTIDWKYDTAESDV